MILAVSQLNTYGRAIDPACCHASGKPSISPLFSLDLGHPNAPTSLKARAAPTLFLFMNQSPRVRMSTETVTIALPTIAKAHQTAASADVLDPELTVEQPCTQAATTTGSENAPFKCNICQRNYTRVDHLARHYRSRKAYYSLILKSWY